MLNAVTTRIFTWARSLHRAAPTRVPGQILKSSILKSNIGEFTYKCVYYM